MTQDRHELRLSYVLKSDPLSPFANAIQSVRMADALAGAVTDFSLIVPSTFSGWIGRSSSLEYERLSAHYRLANRFRIVRIPAAWRTAEGLFPKRRNGAFHRRSAQYLRISRPDAVMTRAEQLAYRSLRYRIPVLFETHAGPQHAGRLERFERLLRSEFLLGIVTISPKLRDLYVRRGVPEGKVLVLPDGIPRALLDRESVASAEAKRRLGLSNKKPIVVYTGALRVEKGIDVLISAARQTPAVDFLIVGGDSSEVSAFTGGASMPRNCHFAGRRPPAEIPLYLDAAEICVLPNTRQHPSHEFTSPLKLFEYMASRRPIIASRIGAFEDLLEDGRNALLVAPEEPEALSAAIEELLRNDDVASRLARCAFEDAHRYTWESRARRIVGAFAGRLQSAVQRHRRKRRRGGAAIRG